MGLRVFRAFAKPTAKCLARRGIMPRLMFSLALCMMCGLTVPLWAQKGPGVDDRFRQASEAMRKGNLEEAGEGFAAVVKEVPSFAEAHLNLGLVREEQGRLDEAIVSFEKALALKPGLRGANLFLGVAQFRLNQLEKAIVAIQKETATYSRDHAAWMWLGVVRLAQGKPEEAAEALDKAAKLAPDDMDILYHRGRAHLLVSNNSYGRLFKVDSHSWRVHQVIAQANAEADRHMDAVEEYQAAIKLVPTQPGLHEELGSEYRNLGKMQEAEEAFKRELEIDPHNILAQYKLGVLTMEMGDTAKGKEMMEVALRAKPGLLHADYNLGRAEMLLGNDSVAATLLTRTTVIDSDPEVVQQAWYQLGIVYRRQHRMDEAQKAMAMFQKLKDAETEGSQRALEKYRAQQNAKPADIPPAPQNPQ
jgi:tetratricopeptide (TPR) repeat protein